MPTSLYFIQKVTAADSFSEPEDTSKVLKPTAGKMRLIKFTTAENLVGLLGAEWLRLRLLAAE
jgi:hypothetical protein